MTIKREFLENMTLDSRVVMLLRHLEYSLKDIKSYEELTSEEKSIIPREVFSKYFQENGDPLILDDMENFKGMMYEDEHGDVVIKIFAN